MYNLFKQIGGVIMKIMKIKTAKRIIIVGIMGILIMLGYLCGFWAENKISFSNSENEISADLTEEMVDDTIIMEEEIAESDSFEQIEDENQIENSKSVSEIKPKTHVEIMAEECGLIIDEVNLIDSYEDGNWYAYYVYADGDVYVITLKNNAVDVCCQLN